MIVSDEHQFIFIHIPRTAGTSIERSLCEAMGIENWCSFIGESREVVRSFGELDKIPDLYDDPHRKKYEGAKHLRAKELKRLVGQSVWESYFKFTFVRNPWGRSLSSYRKMRKGMHPAKRILFPDTKFFFNQGLKVKYDLLRRSGAQQIDFIADEKGEIIVDFVGKFEDVHGDFKTVCNKIGIKTKLCDSHDATNSHKYRDQYYEWGREIVAHAKADDIRHFGYSF